MAGAVLLYRWFKNVSIARKLYFTVGTMALLIGVELFVLLFSLNTLSSLRAYVGGEGLWSKAQKDAVFHLVPIRRFTHRGGLPALRAIHAGSDRRCQDAAGTAEGDPRHDCGPRRASWRDGTILTTLRE